MSGRDDITALVDAWLDGRAGSDEVRRLEGLLAVDPRHRRDFVRAMRFHHQVRGGLQFLGGVRAAQAPRRWRTVLAVVLVAGLAALGAVAMSLEGSDSLRLVGWSGAPPRIHGGPPAAPGVAIRDGMTVEALPAGPVQLGLGGARLALEPGGRVSGPEPRVLAGGLDVIDLDGPLRAGDRLVAAAAASGRVEVAPWAAWVRIDHGSAVIDGIPVGAGREVRLSADGGRDVRPAPPAGSLVAAVATSYARGRWWIDGPAPEPASAWSPSPMDITAGLRPSGSDGGLPTVDGAVVHLPGVPGGERTFTWRLGPPAGGVHLRFRLGFRALGPMASYDIGTGGIEPRSGLRSPPAPPTARRLSAGVDAVEVDLRLLPVGRSASGAHVCEQVFSDAEGVRSRGLVELTQVDLVVRYRSAALSIRDVRAAPLSHTPPGR